MFVLHSIGMVWLLNMFVGADEPQSIFMPSSVLFGKYTPDTSESR